MNDEKEIAEAHNVLTDLHVGPGTLPERIELFRQRVSRNAVTSNVMYAALHVIQALNPLKSDKDSFLYEIVEFALGETKELPRPSDYGLDMEDIPDMKMFFDEDYRIELPYWGTDKE
jgi:hypothetical protein